MSEPQKHHHIRDAIKTMDASANMSTEMPSVAPNLAPRYQPIPDSKKAAIGHM